MDLMKDYYSKRAEEYESIYNRNDPVRHEEILQIKKELSEYFNDLDVLEAACGTGYWTESISKSAKSITAFDYSPEVIEIAESKNLNAEFIIDDAYTMNNIKGNFGGGCANFWFSHIPKDRINEFLSNFHHKLVPGAKVFMADNIYIEGIGGKLIKKTGDINTYKIRELSNGTSYQIVKNYYSESELKNIFTGYAKDIKIKFGKCFWRLMYTTL